MFQIVPATEELLEEYGAYISECLDSGIEFYETAVKDPRKSLNSVIDAAQGLHLPEGWVPYETYFAVDGKRILGVARIRLGDNDFIRTHIGHIGYETRPAERGRGIAKALLKFVVSEKLKTTALVVCDKDNLASVKVIESVPHEPVGENEDPRHRNPERLKFYVRPVA